MQWLQNLQQKAAQVYGTVDKNAFQGMLPGGASREAGQATPQAPFTPGRVLQRGAIPVPTIIPEIEGPAKFIKSYAGPLGMPFDVQESVIGRDKYLQEQIDRSTVVDGKTSYGVEDKGYVAPSNLSQQLTRGIYGQHNGVVNPETGAVTMREGVGPGMQAYDSNRDTDWHGKQADKAWGDPNNKLPADPGGYLSSKFYQSYAALQDAGWTNKAPMGTQTQTLGYLPVEGGSRKAATAITGNPALNSAGPATSYAVKAGDTLTAIAAANNTTVAELAKKNNIADVNMIGVGQQLRF